MKSRQFPQLTECPLCQQEGQLVESHIIPKFFGRELKKASKSQTLINGINPQKKPRPQDTTKEFLLCNPCELLICKFETAFRNKIMPTNKSLLCPISTENRQYQLTLNMQFVVEGEETGRGRTRFGPFRFLDE